MNRIKVLDKLTSNQIAAGEVIERPVSVIKELVENSIDAGSTRIHISVAGGGLEEISVTDNGEGISKEDLPLALARHATSKIAAASDLNRLHTLGFRGEALASIASVSHLTLVSRRDEDLSGSLLQAEGGEVVKIEEVGAPAGTLVKVKELFFNTPGRLKFIKSASRETTRISNLVYRLAMAFPDISFTLSLEGRKSFSSSGNGNLMGVLAEVYGLNNIDSFMEYRYRGETFEANGYLARPVFCRSNKYHQTFFVNRRYVQNGTLNKAVEEAYHTLLPRERYPVCVINISINPTLVDVNVHPAKRQVRFQGEKEVFSLLKNSIRKTLSENNLTSSFTFPPSTGNPRFDRVKEGKQFSLRPIREDTVEYSMFPDKNETKSWKTREQHTPPTGQEKRIIGQYARTYIVYEDDDENIAFMDQHAAHERILYEKYRKMADKPAVVQQVIPNLIELDRDLAESFREHMLSFQETGFHFEEFGNSTFMLRAIPVFIHKIYTSQLIRDIIEEVLRDDIMTADAGFRETIYMIMACKAAVKANESLTEGEMEALVREYEEHPTSTCPHGRPAVVVISKKDMAKNFLRNS